MSVEPVSKSISSDGPASIGDASGIAKAGEAAPSDTGARLISEGVVIVVLTAMAYIYAYLYELGYARFFGIPEEFITISIQNLLVFAAVVVFVAFTLLQIIDNLLTSIADGFDLGPTFIGVYLQKRGLLALLCLAMIFASNHDPRTIWISLVVIGAPAAGDCLSAWLMQREAGRRGLKPTFYEALKEHLKKRNRGEDMSRKFLNSNSLMKIYNYSVLMLVPAAFCLIAGRGAARGRESFPIVGHAGEYEILLRRYGDDLVLAKYNPVTNQLSPSYRLVPVAELKDTVVVRKTGRFEPMDLSSGGESRPDPAAEPATRCRAGGKPTDLPMAPESKAPLSSRGPVHPDAKPVQSGTPEQLKPETRFFELPRDPFQRDHR